MKLIDLHQDRSDNSLCTTHKDFFADTPSIPWNAEKMDALNQVDLVRLKQGNAVAIVGAIFIDPDAMQSKKGDKIHYPIEAANFELGRHLKYYDWVVEKSNGAIYQILSPQDLLTHIADPTKIGLLKHLEGFYFQDLRDKEFKVLDEVYEKGVRSVAMTRGTDSNMCGGNNDNGPGLNKQGKLFMEKLASKRMLIDLAHISQQGFSDVMDIVKRPVMVSHTKITDRDDKARPITALQAKQVADGGGIIGMMTMKSDDDGYPVVDLPGYVAHIKHTINMVGGDHVAIGTDFDGLTREHAITGYEHIGQTNLLVTEMEKQGLNDNQIEKVLHQNAMRFIIETI